MKFRAKLLVWFLQLLIVGILFIIYAIFKLDDFFDNIILELWSAGQIVIVSFRLLVYFFPAIIVWIIWKLFSRKSKMPIVEAFKCQFILFTFLKSIWVFSGMDYITSVGLFDVMDSFIIVAGLLLTLIFSKKSSVDPDLLEAISSNSTPSYDSSKWIYQSDEENEFRYVLGHLGKNNIIVVGINPNTGVPNDLEESVNRVVKIAKGLGFDGWIMLNLYPERQLTVDGLSGVMNSEHNSVNLTTIDKVIKDYPKSPIVAAWGNDIIKKDYLITCATNINQVLKKQERKWKCFKINKTGHPKHPLFVGYKIEQLLDFNFENRYPPTK